MDENSEPTLAALRAHVASFESDISDLDIEGSAPEDLDGAFIRVGVSGHCPRSCWRLAI